MGGISVAVSERRTHNRRVNMYVRVLCGALDEWDQNLSDEDLFDHALCCRAALPAHALGAGGWTQASLAAEVAYDRALISLAAVHGIDVHARNFAHPGIERVRLEAALARQGIDLEHGVLPPERRPPASPPS
jgi:hypothetical protein